MKNRRRNPSRIEKNQVDDTPHRAQMIWTFLVAVAVGATAVYRVSTPKHALMQDSPSLSADIRPVSLSGNMAGSVSIIPDQSSNPRQPSSLDNQNSR